MAKHKDSIVAAPFAVSRSVTGRISAELDRKGEFIVFGADGAARVIGPFTLAVGDRVTATYQTGGRANTHPNAKRNKWTCGSVTIQPKGWEFGCSGEMSLMLGNVDFPYLNGGGYKAKDQEERLEEIVVNFVMDTAGGYIEGKVEKGSDLHTIKSLTPANIQATANTLEVIGSQTAAFLALAEPCAVDFEDLKTGNPPAYPTKLTLMAAGGVVTFTFAIAARPGTAPVEVEI